MALQDSLDTEALVRGVRRCVGSLPPDESAAMLAAALSAVKGNDAAARALAKVLRSEAKRHNSAKSAAAFAAAGGAAAAAGFVVQGAGTTVLGFSFTGSSIPSGCGTLTTLALTGDATGLTGLVFSNPGGQALEIDYYTGADECASGVFDCAGVCWH